ncbi:MAG: antitoxin MazE-like protein [Geminicoccaceae bacterium]
MAKSAARKMVDYRKRKRAQGLRQVTLWVPDWDDPALHERLKREADLLRDHPSTKEGDEFVEAALVDLEAELEALERSKD